MPNKEEAPSPIPESAEPNGAVKFLMFIADKLLGRKNNWGQSGFDPTKDYSERTTTTSPSDIISPEK
ncbi:MAG: hypothetical protein WCJ58_03230 [bacterium]